MRMDQMDSEDHPELSKRLNALEKRVLLRALSLLDSSDAKKTEAHYVVDITMAMPASFIDRLIEAVQKSASSWPACDSSGEARSPMKLIDNSNTTDVGLWSLLPSALYRKTTRFSKSPDQPLIDIVSDVLAFCGMCGEIFQEDLGTLWPNVPPLVLFIESTHYLVASQRFKTEQEGEQWLAHAKNIFNTNEFVGLLHKVDEEIGGYKEATVSAEERRFPFPMPSELYLMTRVESRYGGWLPSKGLPIQDIRSLAEKTGMPNGKSCDKAVARCVASLRDRGHIVLQGESESQDTKWIFPAECILTGTGYLRAKRLAGEV